MSKGYVIHVGHTAPQKAIVAPLDVKTGMPVSGAEQFEKVITVGAFNLVNQARVWARRILPNGKKLDEGERLEVTDPRYKGDLEFLDWGKSGGQAITIRYLAISTSLDYDYQVGIQKIVTRVEEGTESIQLNPGENRFNPTTQALLIQYFKVHPQNRDSKSKNPDPAIKGYTYYEVGETEADQVSVAHLENSAEMSLLIKKVGEKSKESIRNILTVLKGYNVEYFTQRDADELSTDTKVYATMLQFAQSNPEALMSYLNRFKTEVTDLFSKAESFKYLDTTKDGSVTVSIDGKPATTVNFTVEGGKGKPMVDDIVNNFYEEKYFSNIATLRAICDKMGGK